VRKLVIALTLTLLPAAVQAGEAGVETPLTLEKLPLTAAGAMNAEGFAGDCWYSFCPSSALSKEGCYGRSFEDYLKEEVGSGAELIKVEKVEGRGVYLFWCRKKGEGGVR
jgi:hypothetical protein